ncbi:MAG TPA: hypothetical protein DEA05_14670 [Rhodobacteraceae bacterium]|nr:hypothetical protein [Paracoccaceae bacterium]
MSARRLVAVALFAALLGGMGRAPEPVPPACTVLETVPGEVLGAAARFETVQARENEDMTLSLCHALDADGLPVATLLLRHDLSPSAPPDAGTQRAALLEELAETFGAAPDAREPALGEAALWVADVSQLTIWDRDGRVTMIVTAPGPDAEAIGRALLAALD